MSLREQIEANFLDADGLVSPNPCSPITRNASNNGICYTGEYFTLLELTGENYTIGPFIETMKHCQRTLGVLSRSPINDSDLEGPDDYYGFLSGCYFAPARTLALDSLKYGVHNYGAFNNLNPGHFQWAVMLWRQPQLLAMNIWAAECIPFIYRGFFKLAMLPLTLYVATSIGVSCIGKKQTDGADSWRLTWLLVQLAERNSWICRLASKLWYKRLDNVWGGMAGVAKNYYHGLPGEDHPFVSAFANLDARR